MLPEDFITNIYERVQLWRYLCVREELKRKIQDEVEASEVVGGWFYRNIFLNMKDFKEANMLRSFTLSSLSKTSEKPLA